MNKQEQDTKRNNDKREKLRRLVEESRGIFLIEQRKAFTQVMSDLLEYHLDHSGETAIKIERYFHTLKGSAATLEYFPLAKLGEEYEDYLNSVKDKNVLSNDVLADFLKGLALIQRNLLSLSSRLPVQETTINNENQITTEDERAHSENNEPIIIENVERPLDKKIRILLVEDTYFMSHLIRGKLEIMNLEVIGAHDGEEGVRKGQIECPDLMIVDLMLPKMDGFEVCRQIRANPKTKNIKIMIMSARKSKEDVIRCYKLGIEEYIVKPFTLEDLEQRIKRLLELDQL